MDIYLETAICIENEKYLNATIEKLRNITGYKNLKINVPSKDNKEAEAYTLATFINFNAITEAPFVSQGRYFQIYTLSGNGLITNSKTGGLLANEVLVKLEIEEVSKNISAFIPITSLKTSLIFNTENAPLSSGNTFQPKQSGRGRSYALNFVLLNRDFDMKLIDLLNLDNEFEMNQHVLLTQYYSNTIVYETDCILIGGDLDRTSGDFLNINLSLQEVIDKEVV